MIRKTNFVGKHNIKNTDIGKTKALILIPSNSNCTEQKLLKKAQ